MQMASKSGRKVVETVFNGAQKHTNAEHVTRGYNTVTHEGAGTDQRTKGPTEGQSIL